MNECVNKRQPYSAEICFKIVKNRVEDILFYGRKTAIKLNR